jgi:hypothetical protein
MMNRCILFSFKSYKKPEEILVLLQRILYERQPSTAGATAGNAGENETKDSTQATFKTMNELKEISSLYHALIQWQLELYGKDHENTILVYYFFVSVLYLSDLSASSFDFIFSSYLYKERRRNNNKERR